MKKPFILTLAGAFAMASLFSSCASSSSGTNPSAANSGQQAQPKSLANSLHQTVNNHRKSKGKAPLKRHSGLDRLAYQHSKYMSQNRGDFSLGSKNISHYGFENRALVAKRSYRMENVAENVAGGKISGNISNTLLDSWNRSAKHSYNMMSDWDVTGLGVYVTDEGIVYATQLFATENRSHTALMDRMTGF